MKSIKLIFLKLLITNLYLVVSSNLKEKNAALQDEECLKECYMIKNVWGCFCDPLCIDFKDCCNLFKKGCNNLFDEEKIFPKRNRSFINQISQGSCCSTEGNANCFCDKKCEEKGDCCSDYKTCKNKRTNIYGRKYTLFQNYYSNKTEIFDKKHLQPYMRRDILTPQLQTVYIKTNTPRYD